MAAAGLLGPDLVNLVCGKIGIQCCFITFATFWETLLDPCGVTELPSLPPASLLQWQLSARFRPFRPPSTKCPDCNKMGHHTRVRLQFVPPFNLFRVAFASFVLTTLRAYKVSLVISLLADATQYDITAHH